MLHPRPSHPPPKQAQSLPHLSPLETSEYISIREVPEQNNVYVQSLCVLARGGRRTHMPDNQVPQWPPVIRRLGAVASTRPRCQPAKRIFLRSFSKSPTTPRPRPHSQGRNNDNPQICVKSPLPCRDQAEVEIMIKPSSRGRDGRPWGDVYEFPHQRGEALRLERDTHAHAGGAETSADQQPCEIHGTGSCE